MSWKIFKGIEAEGPNTGQITLFIQHQPPYEELAKQILDNQFNCVYFGAQFKECKIPSTVCYEHVFKLLKKGFSVVVDGPILNYDLNHFLASIEFKNSIHARVIIQVTDLSQLLDTIENSWPKNKIWIKLIDYDKQQFVLFPYSSIQVPDKTLYEKDELIAEGE